MYGSYFHIVRDARRIITNYLFCSDSLLQVQGWVTLVKDNGKDYPFTL